MKNLFLGSVALIALGVAAPAAFAADMRVAPLPAPAPVYTWSGCYVGTYAGNASGKSRQTSLGTLPGDFSDNFNLTGFIGGGTGGCQWQAGLWVIGIEGDGGASNKSGQAFDLAPFNTNFIHQTSERWTSTARLRLGFTWTDRTLLYVTGGGAWAGVEASAWNSANPFVAIHHKQTMSGYSVGGGFEYALGYGWSAKGEYLYLSFTDKTYFNPPDNVTPSLASFQNPIRVNLNDHVFRAGMNYKFW